MLCPTSSSTAPQVKVELLDSIHLESKNSRAVLTGPNGQIWHIEILEGGQACDLGAKIAEIEALFNAIFKGASKEHKELVGALNSLKIGQNLDIQEKKAPEDKTSLSRKTIEWSTEKGTRSSILTKKPILPIWNKLFHKNEAATQIQAFCTQWVSQRTLSNLEIRLPPIYETELGGFEEVVDDTFSEVSQPWPPWGMPSQEESQPRQGRREMLCDSLAEASECRDFFIGPQMPPLEVPFIGTKFTLSSDKMRSSDPSQYAKFEINLGQLTPAIQRWIDSRIDLNVFKRMDMTKLITVTIDFKQLAKDIQALGDDTAPTEILQHFNIDQALSMLLPTIPDKKALPLSPASDGSNQLTSWQNPANPASRVTYPNLFTQLLYSTRPKHFGNGMGLSGQSLSATSRNTPNEDRLRVSNPNIRGDGAASQSGKEEFRTIQARLAQQRGERSHIQPLSTAIHENTALAGEELRNFLAKRLVLQGELPASTPVARAAPASPSAGSLEEDGEPQMNAPQLSSASTKFEDEETTEAESNPNSQQANSLSLRSWTPEAIGGLAGLLITGNPGGAIIGLALISCIRSALYGSR